MDLLTLITSAGYVGITAVIFAESGLFFGFFLPGDSLLFTAGLLASQDLLRLEVLISLLSVAAITGDSVGYWFGKKIGPAIFIKEDGFFFRKAHIERTRFFFEKYGPKAIVLARFVPIVRTFTPILAGVGQMKYRTFLTYNIAGGTGWVISLTMLGYFLGNLVPNIDHYLLPIVLVIIVVSFLPILREWRISRPKK